jgi:hypothetical protein
MLSTQFDGRSFFLRENEAGQQRLPPFSFIQLFFLRDGWVGRQSAYLAIHSHCGRIFKIFIQKL